jgi:biopolymer transport protein ExbB
VPGVTARRFFLIEESMENQPTAVVDNPYGLAALWAQGDFVAKGTLIILVLMSLFSWYIILTKIWDQRKLKNSAKLVEKNFWNAPTIKDGVERIKKGDDFRNIAEDGLRAASHHDGRLTDRIDLHEWITMSLQRSVDVVNSKLQSGMAFLATVGSTAPFVGLFGTVWGIYHALINIGLAGQASIDKVAGPVGEALIMTAIGLAVAVPAVLGYNWLIRRNKAVQDGLRNFAADLHAYLISGARVATGTDAATGGGTRPVATPAAAVRK